MSLTGIPVTSKISATLYMLALLVSCGAGRNCEHQPSPLGRYSFNSTEYNIGLMRWINTADSGQVQYFFDSYREEAGSAFAQVQVQIGDQCAKALLGVEQSERGEIESIMGMDEIGYELKGMEFDVAEQDGQITLRLKSLGKITDPSHN